MNTSNIGKRLKNLHAPFSIAAIAATLLGCNKSPPTATQAPAEPPAVSAAEVKDKYKEAAQVTKDFVVQSKDEFVAATDQKLTDLDRKIEELAAKSASYKDDATVQADKTLADLRAQRDKVKEKFDDLKVKSADAWAEAKAGFTVAMNDLATAYENAKSKFN